MTGRLITPGLYPSATLYPSSTLYPQGSVYAGGPISPHKIALACGPDGTYVDVTDYVEFGNGITRSVGRTDQFTDTAPGTFGFTLNNADGRFTPGNPASPLASTLVEGMGVSWQLGTRLVHTTILSVDIPNTEDAWDQLQVTCDDMLGNAARHGLTTLADGLNQHSGQLLMWLLDDADGSASSAETHGDGLGPFSLHSSNPASTTAALTFGKAPVAGLPGTALTVTAGPGETNWYGTQFGRTAVVSRVTYPHPPVDLSGATPTGFYDMTGPVTADINLNVVADNPIQCAVKSPDTGEWYVTQAINGSNGTTTPYESTRLTRLNAAGTVLDTMILTDGGHGGGIGLEYTGGQMWIHTNWYAPASGGTNFDVVRLKYAAGTYTRAAAPSLTVLFTASQLSATSARTDFVFDTAHGYVMTVEEISRYSKPFRRYVLADWLQGVATQSGATITPADQTPLLQGWQGVGDAAFVYSGAQNGVTASPADPPTVREFKWTDGTLAGTRDVTGLAADSGGTYPDGWYEPQSFTLYQPSAAAVATVYLGMTVGAGGNHTNRMSTIDLQPQVAAGGGTTPAVQDYSWGYWNMWVYPGSTVNLAVTPKFATGGGYSDSFQIQVTPTTCGVKGGTNKAITHTWTVAEATVPHYVSMHPHMVWQTSSGGYWALFITLYIDQVYIADTYWTDPRHGFNVGPLQSADISPVQVNVSVTAGTAAVSGTVQRVSHTSSWTGDESNALYDSLDERRAVLDYITNEVSSAAYAPAGALSDVTIGYPDVNGRSVLDVYNDIVRTEQGHLFPTTTGTLTAPVEQVQLRARDRPTTVKAAFDASLELDGPPSFVRDLTNVASAIQVAGPDGTVTATDATVAKVTSRFITSGLSETILAADDDDLRLWGEDRLKRGENIGIRAQTFTVDAYTTPLDRSTDLLALVPGDRIQLTGLPAARLGFATWDGWLLGVTETHTVGAHKFTLALQPVLPAAPVFDTDRYGCDSEATLNGAITATDTAITVATVTGIGMSTDVPYTIVVDGEQMTVTASTGTALTVTRGAGGTAPAAHIDGAVVDVTPDAYYAY